MWIGIWKQRFYRTHSAFNRRNQTTNCISVILTRVKFDLVLVWELCQSNADLLKYWFSFGAWSQIPKSWLPLHLSVNMFFFLVLASDAQVRKKDRYRKDKRKIYFNLLTLFRTNIVKVKGINSKSKLTMPLKFMFP